MGASRESGASPDVGGNRERVLRRGGFPQVRPAAVFDGTANVPSALKNNDVIEAGQPPSGRFGELAAPTLVVHGSDDPVLPPGHVHALVQAIPGARLVTMEATGDELPEAA